MGWKEVAKADYYSHTQMSMYRRCPKQFEYRYVKGLKQPPKGPLILGTAVHKGIELNYATKYKTKKPAKLTDCQDAFSKSFDASKSGVDFEGKKPGVVKDIGYRMGESHHRELAPAIQPTTMPEKEFMIAVPGVSKPIKGFIDVVGNTKSGKTVADNKTSQRKKNAFDVHVDDQLTTYGLAEKLTTGVAPKAYSMDTLVGNQSGVQAQRIITTRGEERFKALIETMTQVDRGIKAGVFPPTSNAQVCSWCGYADICPVAKVAHTIRLSERE